MPQRGKIWIEKKPDIIKRSPVRDEIRNLSGSSEKISLTSTHKRTIIVENQNLNPSQTLLSRLAAKRAAKAGAILFFNSLLHLGSGFKIE